MDLLAKAAAPGKVEGEEAVPSPTCCLVKRPWRLAPVFFCLAVVL